MSLKMIKVRVADLRSAPWRFSEDLALNHQATRYYTNIQKNIADSLTKDGQLSPIHVRCIGTGSYGIVDGHIVVDAACQIGWTELDAICHGDISDEKALEMYLRFNLNRCGRYGHYHVKLRRVFGQVKPGATNEERAKHIHGLVSWPYDRVLDYVELSESDENWIRNNSSIRRATAIR